MSALTSVVSKAIKEMRKMRITYGGGSRIIEPHTLGQGRMSQELLRAFQTEGVSKSGKPCDWKLLRLDDVHGAELTDETFSAPRPGYHRGDPVMKGGIIAEL